MVVKLEAMAVPRLIGPLHRLIQDNEGRIYNAYGAAACPAYPASGLSRRRVRSHHSLTGKEDPSHERATQHPISTPGRPEDRRLAWSGCPRRRSVAGRV